MPLASIYLWLAIFSFQPHKEERFMYVIYPLICYNATQAIETCTTSFQKMSTGRLQPSVTRGFIHAFRWGIFLSYSLLSLARILAVVRAYGAPMEIYENIMPSSTICLAKDWYRFPSSFFIPTLSRPFFVKSAFDGLLPGKFYEGNHTHWRSGTWRIPSGMNNQNREDLSHLVCPHRRLFSSKGRN
jgi:alpha-1,2-mannosyltransferase